MTSKGYNKLTAGLIAVWVGFLNHRVGATCIRHIA